MLRTFAVCVVVGGLSGCGAWSADKPKPSFAFVSSEHAAGIFAWKPDAAVSVVQNRPLLDANNSPIYREVIEKDKAGNEQSTRHSMTEPKTCVMSAAAIRVRDAEAGISLTPPKDVGELSAVWRELQKIAILGSPSAAATYLDVAMFGICLAAMNNHIDQKETAALIAQALKEASQLGLGAQKGLAAEME
ncbi:hypothetical protein EUC41_01195 [Achromobacter denitrificans]|uniref:hypothetical protein n=1 Tax=Achromobacter denitrificans TaxID=32002 RepID=UPI00240DD271|nr:hypothetical protein [Achromobacter denitrificans]MBV2159112.1 hypothetical protein [Achromobacter denitrificans]MDX3879682.1 hypothetical protein [Achromobacter sp.]WFC65049.1 hypothetical protein EUC41_01195 [Achromobacter denitrificans]